MSTKKPRSLRNADSTRGWLKSASAYPETVAAAAILAAGTTTAEAQQAGSSLPPVTVDAPRIRPKSVTVAPKPTPSQSRARAALRRKVKQQTATSPQPVTGPGAPSSLPILAQGAVDANPYAQPGDPYKVNRVQSQKFAEPIANTPRVITVLPKEVLADKGATTLREIGRSTAGITLGTGEGGNAFGDRFFIRGFDARNDIFVDGIRDPAVSVRENFFTEQVEILRGPGSSFAGRGTTGGAINIVTKQASFDHDFRILEVQGSPSDNSKRVTVDINQVVSPVLAVRANGMYQAGGVAGRNYVTDNRWGGHGSVVFKPVENLTLTATFTHVDLQGLPDFGVPYLRAGINRPFTEGLVNRNTYYGFINRDFQKVKQDIGTITGEYKFNENVSLSTKFRKEGALLNYVGTLAEGFSPATGLIGYNPQSRYQTVGVFANQTEAVIKFDTGPIRNTSVVGMEFSHEQILRDSYTGLRSEALPGGFSGTGSTTGSPFFPNNTLPFTGTPTLAGTPTNIGVDTKSAYLIHTANYQDYIILNGGVRIDDYTIRSTAPANYFINLTQGTINKNLTTINSAWQTSAYNHSTMLNFNVGAVWKPIPIMSVYGAYATSSNPVGAELDGTTAQYGGLNYAAQIFSPEKNKAVEVGTKFELFERRLLLTGALFQTTRTNAREITGTGAAAVVSANAAYQVRGIDLEVAGKITDQWSLIGGLVLMNTKVLKSAYPSNVGLPLSEIAHASFSMLSKYQVLPWLELGGQAVYNSRRYGGTYYTANGGTAFNAAGFPAPTAANPFVNVPTVLPSYWRFDSFAEFKVGDNLKGKFAVYNIFNRTYYDSFYMSSAPFAIMAPGRVIQFTATATF